MPSNKFTQSPQDTQPSDSSVEIITPLKVHSHDGQPDVYHHRPLTVKSISFLALLFVAIAIGGFIFVHHLSKSPVSSSEKTDQVIQKQADVYRENVRDADLKTKLQKKVDPEKLALEKKQAEKELGAFLNLRKDVEEKGADQWGGNKWNDMINLSKKADTLFMEHSFLAAAEKYLQAREKAAELADITEIVFEKLIEDGRKALEDGDSNIARQKFNLALKIDPSNKPAQLNLKQAEKLEGVNRLIEMGKNHEKNNQPALAHTDYQEALKLDPESRKAQKAIELIKERITDEQVQQLMSEGLSAYHKGDYQTARNNLLKARIFRPDSREVQEALTQVNEAIRLDKIEKLRLKAMNFEKAEDWAQALGSYLMVLKIDPNISFAIQGKERSLKHILIDKRISFFLNNPDALESDRQLQNAEIIIEEAGKSHYKGPRFNAGLAKLKVLVDVARTPVKVIITSDNHTAVTVYKVGQLGRFTRHELLLRPGKYTVIGARNGYKDVRQKIIVKPDQKTLPVTIICSEKV